MPTKSSTKAGTIYPSELSISTDRKSGLSVKRITNRHGHSNHCYFNVDGMWDNDQQIILSRDIDGRTELFSAHLEDGTFIRLTDADDGGAVIHPTAACVSSVHEEAYFYTAHSLWAVHLRTYERRKITDIPQGFSGANMAITCDHVSVCTILTEKYDSVGFDVSTEEKVKRNTAIRHNQVVTINLKSGAIDTLHATHGSQLGHANPSPTDSDLLTFCHEGPWLEIDQRIWGLRKSTGEVWKIIPKDADWGVGHEFWLEDGVTIGYHARYKEGTWKHALGWAKVDGSESFQAECAVPTHHAHAWSQDRFILDGTRESGDYLFVLSPEADGWAAPRILCAHDTSRWNGRSHAHPHVCKNGRTVIFASDRSDYCDVYAVTMPEDLTQLPVYENKPYRYYWE